MSNRLKTPAGNSWLARQQNGQAMVEYILITTVIGLVMFIPSPLTNNTAPADHLANAVRFFFRGFSFLISIF